MEKLILHMLEYTKVLKCEELIFCCTNKWTLLSCLIVRQSSGNASEQKFTRNVLLIDDTVQLTTKSQKSAYEEAKIMQHCINVMKQQRLTSDDKKEE